MIVSLVLSITFILYIYWENFILYIIISRDSPVLPSLYSVQIKYKKLWSYSLPMFHMFHFICYDELLVITECMTILIIYQTLQGPRFISNSTWGQPRSWPSCKTVLELLAPGCLSGRLANISNRWIYEKEKNSHCSIRLMLQRTQNLAITSTHVPCNIRYPHMEYLNKDGETLKQRCCNMESSIWRKTVATHKSCNMKNKQMKHRNINMYIESFATPKNFCCNVLKWLMQHELQIKK